METVARSYQGYFSNSVILDEKDAIEEMQMGARSCKCELFLLPVVGRN